jgi:N-methylhydantoinase B
VISDPEPVDRGNGTRDGVRLAILNKRFESIVRKMANTLLRTGRSGVLNSARDFSCCIVTANHELVTAAECYPIHVLRGADLMSRAMIEFHPAVRKGDAFLHNSPYHGNSHAADHTILVPVVDDTGRHRFTVLVKAHQADCGNSLPTTYMGGARDVYEEGALIFPAVQVQRDYTDIEDIVRICEMRIRVPEQWRGDYLAMIGAARIGEQEIERVGREIGWDSLSMHTQDWFDYSEQRMIAALRGLRSGEATASATHDPVPGSPAAGITIQAKVVIDASDAMIDIDLRDNPDSYPCGVNLSQACALSAAMVGVFNCIDHTVPPNAGSYRRVGVHLREGCVVGVPRHPTSTSVATTNLGDRVTCVVQRAIALIDPSVGLADGGAALPPAAGVISGFDPRAGGTPFCNEVILAGGAGPGTSFSDGWLTMLTMGNAGMPFIDSIEVDEIHHPMLIWERRIIVDGEGAGRFRGAPGARVVFEPLGCDFELGYVSDGTVNAAQGANGGLKGMPAQQWKEKPDGSIDPLGVSEQILVKKGERVVSLTAGGGGYGPPLERDPVRVERDVAEAWITRERAEIVYGVVLDAAGQLDAVATETRRNDMMSRKSAQSLTA